MGGQLRSRTRYRRFRAVFQQDEVSALLVRMAVLYEDLRIEYTGARHDEKIESLDTLPPTYRQFYFLRRSTVTLVEFIGAFEYLDQRAEFQPIRDGFPADAIEDWRQAKEFFKRRKEFLKTIRNDYGGHFQLRSCRALIANMDPDSSSTFEVAFGRERPTADPRLHFASDAVAGALMTHRADGEDQADYLHRMIDTVLEGWQHIVQVMHVLGAFALQPRFVSPR